jgi:hypothetical protein
MKSSPAPTIAAALPLPTMRGRCVDYMKGEIEVQSMFVIARPEAEATTR